MLEGKRGVEEGLTRGWRVLKGRGLRRKDRVVAKEGGRMGEEAGVELG